MNDKLLFLLLQEAKKNDQKLLFIYQAPWMKSLLRRYGNDISILDATYKVCR